MNRSDYLAAYSRGRVLDIGCAGESRLGDVHNKIAGKLDCWVDFIGMDIVAPKGARNFVLGDCYSMPFKDSALDTVLLGEVLEHLDRPFEALKEIYRVLTYGGRVIVTVPHAYSLSRVLGVVVKNREQEQNIEHLWLFSRQMLGRLLNRCGFAVTDIRPLKGSNRLGTNLAACAEKSEGR